ncbi:MAG: hypothetical protein IJB45_02995, partial [Clostridia bacterium]|nr:hypothetical protein [Clostridia bacterium]
LDGVFSMNGMFGQQISYYPQYNTVIAVFSSVIDDGENSKLIRNVLTKAFESDSTPEWDNKLSEYLDSRGEKPVACTESLSIPTGKTFYLTPLSDAIAKLMFPASLIPRSVSSSFAVRPNKNLNKISFELNKNVLTVKWFEEEDEVTVNCGLDSSPRFSECRIKGYPYKIWAYAYIKNGVLNAVIKPLNTLTTQHFTFEFSGDTLKLQIKGTPSFSEFIRKNATQSSIINNHPKLRPLMLRALDPILATTEKAMIFKAK